MKRFHRTILIAALMIFLMSCSLATSLLQASGLSSESDQSTNSPAKKNFDGELKIVDQWYSLANGNRIPYGLILENTSPTLTVTKFSQTGIVKDASGKELPITNLNEGTTTSRDIEVMIYPQSRQLFCLGYQVPKDSTVSQVLFSIGEDIQAADLGLQNPLKSEPAVLMEKSNQQGAIGDISARVSNQSSQIMIFPTFEGGAFDASGKLIGCGTGAMNGYAFFPAGSTLPVKFPIEAAASPAKVEVFSSFRSGTVQPFSGLEPIEISGVTFTQVKTYVIPSYTLKNTSDGNIVWYLKNYVVYGPNDELLYSDAVRSSDFPPGATYGPNQGTVWQVLPGKTVSRIEVQVHTMDVRKMDGEIAPDAVTYGPGVYDTNTKQMSTKAKNSSGVALSVTFGVGCYDAGGKIVGIGVGRTKLPANSETPVTGDMLSIGPGEDPQCGAAQRIEFNSISLLSDQ